MSEDKYGLGAPFPAFLDINIREARSGLRTANGPAQEAYYRAQLEFFLKQQDEYLSRPQSARLSTLQRIRHSIVRFIRDYVAIW